jgi:hypothetical protein
MHLYETNATCKQYAYHAIGFHTRILIPMAFKDQCFPVIWKGSLHLTNNICFPLKEQTW